jgi:hypothetical protein
MSYQLYDANGYVADLATGKGLLELLEFLKAQVDLPLITELTQELSISIDARFLEEIDKLPTPEAQSLKDTLAGFIENAKKCDEVLIIGDGIGESEE